MRGVVVVGLLALAIAAAGVAAANERPMAEAGLDQESTVNSTVYLDAGGSLDSDGEIVDYAWEIERPNGTTTLPDCPSCSLTHFVPMRAGQYNVTVSVTDEDGATMTDTMYVSVETLFIPPPASGESGQSGGIGGGGGSWAGGGNSDAVYYNPQTGNVIIELASGSNNVQLAGAERDLSEHGADFNAWMTDEEIDQLVRNGPSERLEEQIRVKGEAAQKLRSSLDPKRTIEYEESTLKAHSRADQTANEVLDFDSESDDQDADSESADDSSADSGSEGSAHIPPDQRVEGDDRDSIDSEDSTSSNSNSSSESVSLNDSHSYVYGPEGCTMAAFC
jgi:hypothetical protein